MRTDRAVGEAAIAAGLLFALLSVAATAASFPTPPGPDTGGPGLFPAAFPTAALAGTLLGGGLVRYTSRTESRLVGLALKVGLAVGIITVSLGYGTVVSPRYFEVGVIRLWYGATLVFTLLFAVVQEAVYALTH